MTTIRLSALTSEWPTSNVTRQEHHYAQAAKAKDIRRRAKIAAMGLEPMMGPAQITATISWADERHRDVDNVSLKAAIDGLKDAGLIADDCTCHLLRVAREVGPKHNDAGRIHVELRLETVGER